MEIPLINNIFDKLWNYRGKLGDTNLEFQRLKNEIQMNNNLTQMPKKLWNLKLFFDRNSKFLRLKENKYFYDEYLIPLSIFQNQFKINKSIAMTSWNSDTMAKIKNDLNKTKDLKLLQIFLTLISIFVILFVVVTVGIFILRLF